MSCLRDMHSLTILASGEESTEPRSRDTVEVKMDSEAINYR